MPRAREHALFDLGGQWIAPVAGTRFYYRHWTEPGSGRTRRASLGTADLETAKLRLAQTVLSKGEKTPDSPLSFVLDCYFEGRTDRLPSGKHARHAGRLIVEFFGGATPCSKLSEARQRAFAEECAARGHSLSYISRNLSVLAAALNYSRVPVKVRFGKRDIKERWALVVKAPRRIFVPSDKEIVRFLTAPMPEALLRWATMALLTGARPEAVLNLTPSQRLPDSALIDLNPEGRVQNKKYRPVVRAPKALARALDRWEGEMRREEGKRQMRSPEEADIRRVPYCTYASVDSVQGALARVRAAINAPLSVYSFRHKVATILRAEGVREDDIAMQLGHKRQHLAVTGMYGERAPDYLREAAAALDRWWARIVKAMNSQGTRKTSRLEGSKRTA